MGSQPMMGAAQEPTPKQMMKCTNELCQKEFVIDTVPPEVANMGSVSLVVFTHPEPQVCPHCGAAFQMRILAFKNVVIEWVRVPGPGGNPIIIPPGGYIPPPPSEH